MVGVKIIPKKEVLDVQGRAVAEVLLENKYPIKSCSCGKFLKLDIKAKTKKQALKTAEKALQFLLYNPLVEDYELELL